MYTLIQTAMLHGVDPQAWLADVLDRIDHPITDLPANPWLVRRPKSGRNPPAGSPRLSTDASLALMHEATYI